MTAPIKSRWRMLVWVIFAAGFAATTPAAAGPPFITDDPEPVDLGHWEVYGFSAATHVGGDTSGTLGGVGRSQDLRFAAAGFTNTALERVCEIRHDLCPPRRGARPGCRLRERDIA